MQPGNLGKLIILTGLTASGKDAIMHQLLKLHPDIERIITATTREKREVEREGIDYNFVSREEFERKNDLGEFLEINIYSGNFYGTPKSEFQKVLDGKTIIWRIDPTMAARAKEFFKTSFDGDMGGKLSQNTLVICVNSSWETLQKRLSRRGLSIDEVKQRIEQDKLNWENCKDKFDYIVENEEGKLSETVKKIVEIIEKSQ
jgi:guanylate kinase